MIFERPRNQANEPQQNLDDAKHISQLRAGLEGKSPEEQETFVRESLDSITTIQTPEHARKILKMNRHKMLASFIKSIGKSEEDLRVQMAEEILIQPGGTILPRQIESMLRKIHVPAFGAELIARAGKEYAINAWGAMGVGRGLHRVALTASSPHPFRPRSLGADTLLEVARPRIDAIMSEPEDDQGLLFYLAMAEAEEVLSEVEFTATDPERNRREIQEVYEYVLGKAGNYEAFDVVIPTVALGMAIQLRHQAEVLKMTGHL